MLVQGSRSRLCRQAGGHSLEAPRRVGYACEMRTDRAFRLSFYTTLAISCLSLGVAEFYFIPWMMVLAVMAVGMIVLAYQKEGRWALNEELANILGLLIGASSLAWIYFQLPRSEEELVARGIPWPAGLLPHVGPLLLGLLLVKLFRPKRHADFWSIQIIGLMMMMLACVLTGEILFGLLLVAYFASVLWCLGLFYAHRQRLGGKRSTKNGISFLGDCEEGTPRSASFLGLGQALQRASVLLPISFMLFLLAPRRTDSEWIPYKLSTTRDIAMRTGTPTDIDLNHVGKIELSEKPAFEVTIEDSKGLPAGLAADQRFRANTLDYYRNGRWQRLVRAFPVKGEESPKVRLRANLELPDLGADQIRLQFRLNPQNAGNFVLAEPVLLGAQAGEFPYMRMDDSLSRNLFYEVTGTGTLMPYPNPFNREYTYEQVSLPQDENPVVPARHVSSDYLRYLINQRVPPEITDYTRDLLGALKSLTAEEGQLSSSGEVPPQYQRKVAEALENHLTSSGEFGYSLVLRRYNSSIDPTVDFLLNLKKGHCERFAAALALMLRSVGIPSRLVGGFRGGELLKPGVYEIREKHAHSWVEALVPDSDDPSKLYWLPLDPTPENELVELGFFDWWRLNWHNGRAIWRDLILEYDIVRQQQAFVAIAESVQQLDTWLYIFIGGFSLACGIMGVIFLRRYHAQRKRLRDIADGLHVPFYQRFLDVAGQRIQLRPASEQTPREFAAAAASRLADMALPVSLISIPECIVTYFYRVRFGGHPLNAAELAQIDSMICQLDAALKTPH